MSLASLIPAREPVGYVLTVGRLGKHDGDGYEPDVPPGFREKAECNHWVEGVVGCAVAACMQSCSLPSTEGKPVIMRGLVSFAELRRKMRK